MQPFSGKIELALIVRDLAGRCALGTVCGINAFIAYVDD